MNIELFRLARGNRGKKVQWNTEANCLELVGKPNNHRQTTTDSESEEVTPRELRQYIGWLLGTFAVTKRFQDTVLASGDAANSHLPLKPLLLLGWEAKWSPLTFRARADLTSFGLLPTPNKFLERISVQVDNPTSAMYTVANKWHKGEHFACLWIDNFSRYNAHLALSKEGEGFVSSDRTVACLHTFPGNTKTLRHCDFTDGPVIDSPFAVHLWCHPKMIDSYAAQDILRQIDRAQYIATSALKTVCNRLWGQKAKVLPATLQHLVGTDTKYIQLLPQSYVTIPGDHTQNIPSKRYAIFKPRCTTFPLDLFPWACGSVTGKFEMLGYVCKQVEYFREREECLVCELVSSVLAFRNFSGH